MAHVDANSSLLQQRGGNGKSSHPSPESKSYASADVEMCNISLRNLDHGDQRERDMDTNDIKGTVGDDEVAELTPPGPVELDPTVALDEKDTFWEEYYRYSSKYDAEMVKGLSDDLNTLLIFAGLFSAVNTAFIIESMDYLRPDNAEITNDLLRTLILNLHDPSTFTPTKFQSSSPFVATHQAVRINALFFASLCCSLFTAFGAVLGRHWLNHYENDGLPRPLPELCRERQMKLMGFERWHFQGVLETLPNLLQLSLFFFLLGLIDWAWSTNKVVAGVIIGFACLTVLFYAITTTISVYDPGSPFTNGFARYIRHFFIFASTRVKYYGIRVFRCMRMMKYHALWAWPFILLYAAIISTPPFHTLTPTEVLGSSIHCMYQALSTFRSLLLASISLHRSPGFGREEEREIIDPYGAECVTWLAEQHSNSAGASEAFIDASIVLDPLVFKEKPWLLKRVITCFLRPRQIGLQGLHCGLVLDVATERLRKQLDSLYHLISLIGDEVARIGSKPMARFIYDNRMWKELCHRLWMILAENPEDEQAVTLVSDILRLDRLSEHWSGWCPSTDLQALQRRFASTVQEIAVSNEDISVESKVTGSQLNDLCVLCSAFVVCIDAQRVSIRDLKLGNNITAAHNSELLKALNITLTIDGKEDADYWRGSLRLLWLHSEPEAVYPLIQCRTAEFSSFLWIWVQHRSQHQRSRSRTQHILYLNTLKFLLLKDHSCWYDPLRQAGHLDYLRRQMIDEEVIGRTLLDRQNGRMIALASIMSIWSNEHLKDDKASLEFYGTPSWLNAIRDAIENLGAMRSSNILNHSWNDISPQAVIEILQSCLNYIQASRCSGLVTQQDFDQVIRGLHSMAHRFLDRYNPTMITFFDIRQSLAARMTHLCQSLANVGSIPRSVVYSRVQRRA
ncbi:hypothetical protein FRC02_010338 [Tulasnella sp. 418]|nr:hypothetical protein FRC02_010338 [Tulasnella sp. 418]